jgi:hypothetical protein
MSLQCGVDIDSMCTATTPSVLSINSSLQGNVNGYNGLDWYCRYLTDTMVKDRNTLPAEWNDFYSCVMMSLESTPRMRSWIDSIKIVTCRLSTLREFILPEGLLRLIDVVLPPTTSMF